MVGAGAAGLAAAATLRNGGKRVLVLEARERWGGRILTVQPEGSEFPVELGAEFIHGEPAVLRDYVSLSDSMPMQWWRKTHGKRVHADGILKNTERVFQAIGRRLGAKDESFETASAAVADLFPKELMEQARSFVAGFYAAPLSQVSARATVQAAVSIGDDHSDHSYLLPRGYASVLDGYLRALAPLHKTVRFRSPVRWVRWQKGEVEVAVGDRQTENILRAERLVVTVPIDVLKDLEFQPALESKAEAFQFLAMGPVHRVVLRFAEPFWELRDFHPGYLQSPESPFVTFWTARPWPEAHFTCWSGGSQTENVGKRPVAQAVESLAAALDFSVDKLQKYLIDSHYHNWCRDPFSRGAYSYVRVGGENAREILAEPLDDTLYFAGEACALDDRTGTVDGAIATGLKAADEILRPAQAKRWHSHCTFRREEKKMGHKLLAVSFFSLALGLNSLVNAAAETGPEASAYKSEAQARLKDWDDKIEVVKRRADAAAKPQRTQWQANARDLEAHRDRIKDELSRVGESNADGKNTAAEGNIARHFEQMESLYSSNRPDGAEGQGRL